MAIFFLGGGGGWADVSLPDEPHSHDCRRGVRRHPPQGKFLNESGKCHFPRFEDEIIPFLTPFYW